MEQTFCTDMRDEDYQYIDDCARIRHISVTRLLSRLIHTVSRDQLVLAILDDDSKPIKQLPGETSKSKYRYSRRSHGTELDPDHSDHDRCDPVDCSPHHSVAAVGD